MELNLQPRADACCVSRQAFHEGDRVASLLVLGEGGAVVRYDALEASAAELSPAGFVACRWVQAYKPRPKEENRDREIKLTAENLFVTLADPSTQPSPETDRLIRFLALLLERKRILRPRGTSPDGSRELFEHAKTKQIFEVAALALTPEFFSAVQGQLAILVGEPKAREPSPEPAAAPAE